ncbi:hypothetical protein CK203_016335 [Vitis vinifera]|uniref:Uncharacterized protein n=1 Tax=Vitis vinifera TaxID=29760 RepID=A0A438J132_VITVI|nr:hypothetical protein CK203_016335 [Vitis vinifera]
MLSTVSKRTEKKSIRKKPANGVVGPAVSVYGNQEFVGPDRMLGSLLRLPRDIVWGVVELPNQAPIQSGSGQRQTRGKPKLNLIMKGNGTQRGFQISPTCNVRGRNRISSSSYSVSTEGHPDLGQDNSMVSWRKQKGDAC